MNTAFIIHGYPITHTLLSVMHRRNDYVCKALSDIFLDARTRLTFYILPADTTTAGKVPVDATTASKVPVDATTAGKVPMDTTTAS